MIIEKLMDAAITIIVMTILNHGPQEKLVTCTYAAGMHTAYKENHAQS